MIREQGYQREEKQWLSTKMNKKTGQIGKQKHKDERNTQPLLVGMQLAQPL